MKKYAFQLSIFFLLFFCLGTHLLGQSKASPADEHFTVENYYKVKWGHAQEFIDLWRANHYPLLKKAMEKGDIISVTVSAPVLHSGEDTRWDYRVIIVFKNSGMAFKADLTTPYRKELYPDEAKLERDEQHRFELLIAHWDVMTDTISPEKK